MSIISQDKGKIINFDNMTWVYINFDEGDDDVCIRTETVDSLFEDLGYYKTEERAREVLQEIIETYLDCNEQSVLANYAYENCWCLRNVIYEMPAD